MTSLETQKKLVLDNIIVSGITSIYQDENICSSIPNCDIYLDAQPILKPFSKLKEYHEYYKRIAKYFNNFLYGDETAENTLKLINNITKIYNFSLDTKVSVVGMIFLIIFSVIIAFEVISLLPLIFTRFSINFEFLPTISWFNIFIGNLMLSSVVLTKLDEITSIKCNLQIILFSFGYTFIYIPTLIKLIIVHFSEENKYIIWLKKNSINQFLFFLIALTVDILLNGLLFIKSYGIEVVFIDDGKTYQICKKNNAIIYIVVTSEMIYKILIAVCLLLIIHKEWYKKEIKEDTKYVLLSICINISINIMLFICSFIKMRSYMIYYILQIVLVFIISISNYITYFGVRLVLSIIRKPLKDEKVRKSYNMNPNILRTFPNNCK